jgi:hypothetical protein
MGIMRQAMQKTRFTKLLLIGSVLWSLTVWTDSNAQEDDYNLAHRDILGKPRRPPVSFSHEIHSDELGIQVAAFVIMCKTIKPANSFMKMVRNSAARNATAGKKITANRPCER